jgi:hypothetical protein
MQRKHEWSATMISHDYLLDKLPAPSQLRRFLTQRIVPGTVDATGWVEAGLEHISEGTKRQPAIGLGLAVGLGFLLPAMNPRSRMRRVL